MTNRIKICIPSKNRPNTKTYKIFKDLGFDVYMFVEPQDIDKYPSDCNLINIEKNNQGIAYVRNHILKHAKKENWEWICMCDDDVIRFGKAIINNSKRRNQKNNEFIKDIILKTLHYKKTIFGINYKQYSWSSDIAISKNTTTVEVCVWLRPAEIGCFYDYNVNLKEDRDFIIQNRIKGLNIVKLNQYYFDCPRIGENKGGLYDEYKANKDESAVKKMYNKWGDKYITLIKNKKGRLDIKINWKNL
jgi:hypothetical protein